MFLQIGYGDDLSSYQEHGLSLDIISIPKERELHTYIYLYCERGGRTNIIDTRYMNTFKWGVDSPVSIASFNTQFPDNNSISQGQIISSTERLKEHISPGTNSWV